MSGGFRSGAKMAASVRVEVVSVMEMAAWVRMSVMSLVMSVRMKPVVASGMTEGVM